MMRRGLALVLAVVLTVSCSWTAAAEGWVIERPLPEPDLLAALAAGGNVVYFRHAATDIEQRDHDHSGTGSCAEQRNLSKAGRDQAAAMGKAIAALGLKFGDILSSPYCRCRDTADLLFGRYAVVTGLAFALSMGAEDTARLNAVLRASLSAKPAPGANTAVVAHTANLKEATGLWPKPEGAAHVFRPTDDGTVLHLGRIAPETWERWVATPR